MKGSTHGMASAAVLAAAVILTVAQGNLCAQNAALASSAATLDEPEVAIAPTWETQTNARTYLLGIPAPRGQITDRRGSALAQTRIGYNLAILFPTPLDYDDETVLAYAQRALDSAADLLPTRRFTLKVDDVLLHYKNRGVTPLIFLEDLLPQEVERLKNHMPEGLGFHQSYVRFYPNGPMAGHILGYCGKEGGVPDGPLQNNDLVWPEVEGRDGIEQTFNQQLRGNIGQLNLVVDRLGEKVAEKVSIPPQPGQNVVTTLDEELQRHAESVIAKRERSGAIVVLKPDTGDILAMASWPSFNPNAFTPYISGEDFDALNTDPDKPLFPRAFRAAYPPGSVFKVVTGLAAIESGAMDLEGTLDCPASYRVGNLWFDNWKSSGQGHLSFPSAMAQSCNTWFYQAGLKAGADAIMDWAFRMGLGVRTGIPLNAETGGRVPTHDYFQQTRGRPILDGDVANMSIGQGDLLVSPLQMAQLMATVANGGTVVQCRLVLQVQAIGGKVTIAYQPRAKTYAGIRPDTLAALHKGLVDVVNSGGGTAGRARMKNVKVAGKTGTAQWGPKNRERTAAWFAGFAPAENAEVAFAAVYESRVNENAGGGSHAAPMIAEVLKEYFDDKAEREEAAKDAMEAARAAAEASATEANQGAQGDGIPAAEEQEASPDDSTNGAPDADVSVDRSG